MSIQYSLIAKDKEVVLVEYKEFSGNFQQLVRQLMPKLKSNSKQTFEAGKYKDNNFSTSFHCLTDGNLQFICMTDSSVKKVKAYKFLDSIKQKFYSTFQMNQINTAIAYGLPFIEELRNGMVTIDLYQNHFNYNIEEEDKAEAVLKELVDARDIIVEDLSKDFPKEIRQRTRERNKDKCYINKNRRVKRDLI